MAGIYGVLSLYATVFSLGLNLMCSTGDSKKILTLEKKVERLASKLIDCKSQNEDLLHRLDTAKRKNTSLKRECQTTIDKQDRVYQATIKQNVDKWEASMDAYERRCKDEIDKTVAVGEGAVMISEKLCNTAKSILKEELRRCHERVNAERKSYERYQNRAADLERELSEERTRYRIAKKERDHLQTKERECKRELRMSREELRTIQSRIYHPAWVPSPPPTAGRQAFKPRPKPNYRMMILGY